ncbi:MAG: hypothetical protein JXB23_12065 [Candidatus Aminicenantes bacterium]|nr:hypothetical protein [Candidatus Aminicenantes bacterium]
MSEKAGSILTLVDIKSAPRSEDFVQHKQQFQLHKLCTEQRHPKTWNLSSTIKASVLDGLSQILAVDADISEKFQRMAQDSSLLEQAALAVYQSIMQRKKIFIYGCGSTGRLAKQMESTLWRPFWRKVKDSRYWEKLKRTVPDDIEDRLIGEMTGGDRALISALEGFEDLEVVGRLQLKERNVEQGDCVFAVTEGGETSSVIGAIKAALDQYGELSHAKIEEAGKHLYFIYNNPDDDLMSLERSRSVIGNPAITKINLTTGPQAIAGSTRMQATTSETFVVGSILEAGIFRILRNFLTEEDLKELGFAREERIKDKLQYFDAIRRMLANQLPDIARFTALESEIYKKNHRATYFAKKALITVFVDCAERSPTFHLHPLDTVFEKNRKCWLQVWTEAKDCDQAWFNFLGRRFHGLAEDFYKPVFAEQIDDAYLRKAALMSLTMAGEAQKQLYDFSFSQENMAAHGPRKHDLGVLVCVDEEIEELNHPRSSVCRFIKSVKKRGAPIVLIMVGETQSRRVEAMINRLPLEREDDIVVSIDMHQSKDPLGLKKQTILKILLNAHSTGVMAALGRVVGNTMTNVNPSNLKLIGRATSLIISHVNDVLSQQEWIQKYGGKEPITYAEANAVLFAALDFVAAHGSQTSEVELSIIRILESLRTKECISWEAALSIATSDGLENYLERLNPALRS